MPDQSIVYDEDGNPTHIRETSDDGRESTLYEYDDSFVAYIAGDRRGKPVEVSDHLTDGTTRAYEYEDGLLQSLTGDHRGARKDRDSDSRRGSSSAGQSDQQSDSSEIASSDDASDFSSSRTSSDSEYGETSSAYSGTESTSAVGWVAVLVFVAALAWWWANPSRPNVVAAPDDLVDSLACLGEACGYGGRYFVERTVPVFSARPLSLSVSSAAPSASGELRSGQWVTAVTGLVIATRGEGRITERSNRRNAGKYPVGLVVPFYGEYSEGCGPAWIDSKEVTLCDLDIVTPSHFEWWIRLRLDDGSLVWSNGLDGLTSNDVFTTRLAEFISADTIPLDEKQWEISAAVARKVDINGTGGQYGRSVLDGAISSNDTAVLSAFLDAGGRLSSAECPLYWSTQHSLEPNGDVMLEFLLSNGGDLKCLRSPPFSAFLQTDLSSAQYPLAQAIKVVDVLIAHGADPLVRDTEGKSFLDILADPRWADRVGPLRAAVLRSPPTDSVIPPP